MAELKARTRNKLPESKFGLPGERKYPMPDRSHAANAKARATQQVKAGNLSPASAARIRAKADRLLGKGKG
jgi:hypothetical protein